MRLGTPPPPSSSSREGDFGFGSPPPEKESLPSSLPSRLEKNSRRASHVMPVLSDFTNWRTHMYALIILACCFAAWPIHLCITRPIIRMMGLID